VPTDPNRTVIIATTPSDALAGYIPFSRQSRYQPRPPHLYWLTTATTAVTFERLDERTLRVTPEGGFLRHQVDQMTRSPRARRFVVGDRVALSGLELEIETVMPDGRPQSVLARFAASADDPALTWLRWQGQSYVAYRPPAVGSRETLPAIDFAKLLED
jgi:hypothetical protein